MNDQEQLIVSRVRSALSMVGLADQWHPHFAAGEDVVSINLSDGFRVEYTERGHTGTLYEANSVDEIVLWLVSHQCMTFAYDTECKNRSSDTPLDYDTRRDAFAIYLSTMAECGQAFEQFARDNVANILKYHPFR